MAVASKVAPDAELYCGDKTFKEQVCTPVSCLKVMVDHVGGNDRPIPVVVQREKEAITNVGKEPNYGCE